MTCWTFGGGTLLFGAAEGALGLADDFPGAGATEDNDSCLRRGCAFKAMSSTGSGSTFGKISLLDPGKKNRS